MLQTKHYKSLQTVFKHSFTTHSMANLAHVKEGLPRPDPSRYFFANVA